MSRGGWVCAVVSMSIGCGIQAGGSVPVRGAFEEASGAVHLEGRLVNVLGETDGYASGQIAFANPEGAQAGFGPRQGTVGGGIRLLNADVSLEAGGEVGVGEPMLVDFTGPGLYMGGILSPMVRIVGHQDVEPGFSAAGILLDVGLTVRSGAWVPPTGSGERIVAESSGQLAIRVTVISDLLDASGKEIDQ